MILNKTIAKKKLYSPTKRNKIQGISSKEIQVNNDEQRLAGSLFILTEAYADK